MRLYYLINLAPKMFPQKNVMKSDKITANKLMKAAMSRFKHAIRLEREKCCLRSHAIRCRKIRIVQCKVLW